MSRIERGVSAPPSEDPVVRLGPGGQHERRFHEHPTKPGRLVEIDRREALREERSMLKGLLRYLAGEMTNKQLRLSKVERELRELEGGAA